LRLWNSKKNPSHKYMAERLVQTQDFFLSFFFFKDGTVYSEPGLMAADGSHLSQRGKCILAQELAGLVERTLN